MRGKTDATMRSRHDREHELAKLAVVVARNNLNATRLVEIGGTRASNGSQCQSLAENIKIRVRRRRDAP
jgi:hypothetical protein